MTEGERELYLQKCRQQFAELKAGWTKDHCKWWDHEWADVSKDSRGWTETKCSKCGKFYGFKKPDMVGIVQAKQVG